MSSSDFLDRYEANAANLPGNAAVRKAAAEAFSRFGLPGERPRDKNEAWKYTSLRPLAAAKFGTPRQEIEVVLAGLPLLDAPRLVFGNGTLREDLSTMLAGTGTAFGMARPDRDPMVALNTMLTSGGAVIHVDAGQDGGMVQIVHVASGEVDCHPRHVVRVDNGGSLTLVEISAGDGTYLQNSVMEIQVGPGATLRHVRMQNDATSAFSVSTIYANVGANAVYDCFTLNLGARLSRSEMHVRMGGASATAHLNGVQLLAGSQHADFTSIIDHAAYGCTSRQAVKNVLAGRSRGVFQGKIHVDRTAQKTDGYQMSQALLLSPEAEIDTKPELEIYADDVKCSHGATVGELDAEQIFYLRSRGIPDAEARAILIRAFLAEAVDTVADEAIRSWLTSAVEIWWQGQTV